MTYAITGFKPATSNVGHAKQIFEVFDSLEEAKAAGEKLLKTGGNDVSLWEHKANPVLRTTVDWADPNTKVTYSDLDRQDLSERIRL